MRSEWWFKVTVLVALVWIGTTLTDVRRIAQAAEANAGRAVVQASKATDAADDARTMSEDAKSAAEDAESAANEARDMCDR